MANKLKLEEFQADLEAVNTLYELAVARNDPFGKFQLAKRKELIVTKIEELRARHEELASVELYFGGKPVLNSNGISADFSGNIINQFQKIISNAYAIIAKNFDMGGAGRIPYLNHSKLFVTGVTRGSFGFVLDEIKSRDHPDDHSLKDITQQVLQIINRSAFSNDDEFDEVIKNLDERIIKSLNEFFNTLKAAKATLRVVEGSSDYNLDYTSIVKASERISAIESNDVDIPLKGEFKGLMSVSKEFEFLVEGQAVIKGSITNDAISELNDLIIDGKSPLYQHWQILVNKRTIKSINRPDKIVYKLLEFISPFDKPGIE